MADVVLSFTIADAKVQEAVEAFCAMYPNATNEEWWTGDPLSDGAWVKWRIRKWVNDTINSGRKVLHQQNNPAPEEADFAE